MKLSRITSVVHDHFYGGERVMLLTPSDEAASYIDNLLWRLPEESFIPHVTAKNAVDERVVISTIDANLNQAGVLLNLSPSVPSFCNECKVVYDLMDMTHPAKEELAHKRLSAYQALGCKVEVI